MVDTHRHLGGSVPIEFLVHAMEIGACASLPYSELEKKIVCLPNEPKEFNHFLSKFRFLDKIKWTEELVSEKIRFVCEKINNENICGVFIDFSVGKYRHIGWSLSEAITHILDCFDEYSDILVIPILSIKYESPKEVQLKIAQAIDDATISDRIGGIDFVGDESKFDPEIQQKICDMWRGKMVRLHVGESQGVNHVMQAISDFKATNIAHGIKIVDDQQLLDIAIESGTVFDIAPTSNYITGVIPEHSKHPSKKMFDAGVTLTVGSDDPIQCQTDLFKEYKILADNGFSDKNLDVIASNAKQQLIKWAKYGVGNKQIVDHH